MPENAVRKWWECGRHVRCAPKGARWPRSEHRGAPRDARGCACAARHVLVRGRCCASRRARAFTPSCRASIVPRRYGDDEAAREAAGKAALLRAKESLSTGWAARLCCEQRGRLVAAWPCRLRGVRQRGLFKPLIWPESARQREPRERGQGFRVPVCACAVIVGVCMPQRGAPVCVECRG